MWEFDVVLLVATAVLVIFSWPTAKELLLLAVVGIGSMIIGYAIGRYLMNPIGKALSTVLRVLGLAGIIYMDIAMLFFTSIK